MNSYIVSILILVGSAAMIYYTGYRHGYHARGVRHWRTFNRLVAESRE